MFNKKQKKQLLEAGIPEAMILQQIKDFERGFPFANIDRPATLDDGIKSISEEEANHLRELFKIIGSEQRIHRFVPASGAATRMFKDLYAFLNDGTKSDTVDQFFERIDDFPFASFIPEELKKDPKALAEFLLEGQLGYGNKPKALIPFHRYEEGPKEALAEHFFEASKIAGDIQKDLYLHFSVSPTQFSEFQQKAKTLALAYGARFKENFILEYTEQSPATQTLAVNMDNTPVLDEEGKFILRPGGHGALIHNLAAIFSDIIFIKNIDNVCHESQSELSIFWKEVLGGKLIDIRQQVFEHMDNLLRAEGLEKALAFLKAEFGLELEENIPAALKALNRPIRVCGMVKNEGKAGGGPFWVKDQDGQLSLQIVEASQINTEDSTHRELLSKATHFNPVDIVCSTKNHKGEKFRLHNFIDPYAGFISTKNFKGKDIKAMELPGLWNGAMANWLTIFAEVPFDTFNPVKSVNDLLEEKHQAAS